jgi:hypothetical protein
MGAEKFPGNTLDTVSLYRQPNVLFSNYKTEPVVVQIVAATEQEKIFMGCTGVCAIEYALIGASIKQAIFSGKGKPAHKRQRQASGCEAFPTFGASPIDQVAAVLGGHARAKAVGALAFEDAGLKGSFHDK